MPFTVDPTGEIIPMTPEEFFSDLTEHRARLVDMSDEKLAHSLKVSLPNLQAWLAQTNSPNGVSAALVVRRLELIT